MKTESSGFPVFRGSLTLKKAPAHVGVDVARKVATPLFRAKNMVVAGATTALIQLMRGNTALYTPSFISLGSGGDYEQSTGLDTGLRVSPSYTDNSLRERVARIPITYTEDGETSSSWKFVAVAKPHEALTTGFNELGVETDNGTLITHFVTEAGLTGKAEKYAKTSLEYLIVEWELTLLMATPVSFVTATSGINTNLLRSDVGGDNTTGPGYVTPGTISSLSLVSSGGVTVDNTQLNAGDLIQALLPDGTSAVIVVN